MIRDHPSRGIRVIASLPNPADTAHGPGSVRSTSVDHGGLKSALQKAPVFVGPNLFGLVVGDLVWGRPWRPARINSALHNVENTLFMERSEATWQSPKLTLVRLPFSFL